MLARRLEEMYPQRRARQLGPKVLEVRGLRRGEELRGHRPRRTCWRDRRCDRPGRSGQDRVRQGRYGADPVEAGTVRVAGQERTPRSPADGIEHGVALVPEDRKTQGLVLMLSVADNLALGVANCGRVAGTLAAPAPGDLQAARRRAGHGLHQPLQDPRARPEQLVLGLSGGNQQKVVLSKCLATKPVLMILDEPTRGGGRRQQG